MNRKDRDAKYYQENKEKCRASRKAWYEANKERLKAEAKAAYVPTGGVHGLPPVTEKVCPVCKVLKPRSGYYKKLKTISHKCKECTKAESKETWPKYTGRYGARISVWNKERYANDPQVRAKARDHIKRLQAQTPAWADMDAIRQVYAQCPKGFDVDHMIPLKGKLVSGLHVHTNLQILPMSVNRSKSNSYTV
jgi:hypothetical protein